MEILHRAALAIARIGAITGGALLLLSAVIIGIDVVLRAAISVSLGGADELSGYALAIATAWGLSFSLLQRAHIRIDTLRELAPRGLRAALDILGILGFLVFAGLVTRYAAIVLSQSVMSNARSISALAVPVAVPQAVWVCGLVFLILVLLLLLVQSTAALARGNLDALFYLIGSKAVIEEISEEKQDHAKRERAERSLRS